MTVPVLSAQPRRASGLPKVTLASYYLTYTSLLPRKAKTWYTDSNKLPGVMCMANNVIAVNLHKIKAAASVNRLVAENYRGDKDAQKYDDGHRNIDTSQTGGNVFLIERPDNYDKIRKQRIETVNEGRAARVPKFYVPAERQRQREAGTYQAERTRQAAQGRKLRADTVDTLGIVVQPSADYINALSRDDQTRYFADALDVMRSRPDYFGQIETAVIHYDETTPHMQCLSSTINMDTLTSDASKIMGNKSKMSDRQTLLADGMRAKGWDVTRGIKRIDNPAYTNWADEMTARGYTVNRYTDRDLMQTHTDLAAEVTQLRGQVADLQTVKTNLLQDCNNAQKTLDQLMLQSSDLQTAIQTQSDQLHDQKRLQLQRQNELDAKWADYDASVSDLDGQRRQLRADRDKLVADRQKWQNEANTALQQQSRDLQAEHDRQMQQLNQQRKQLQADRQALADDRQTFRDDKARALQMLKGMAKDVTCRSDAELRRRRRDLMPIDDMDDFTDAVNRLDQYAGGRSL